MSLANNRDIIEATHGILFFGCPNRGMDIKSLIPMCNGQVNQPFLFSLRQDSDVLRQLCRDFPSVFHLRQPRIISFYETKLSPTVQVSELSWLREQQMKERKG
jgi:hypothetical protein